MRHFHITLLIIASIVFIGLEDVAEQLMDDHAISNSHVQVDDHSTSSGHEGDSHHCGHCFHSHAGDIVDAFGSPVIPLATISISYREPNLLAYLQAPPTPPPNA